ncbi:histidine kinase [uncultured Wocania sp.]|mgnify:CR=1 FL=1|uniref:sensor histidine kinase n=1 Tax=uncultured Wocania sp. TaxID=2834404 RepID=UPI0030F53F42
MKQRIVSFLLNQFVIAALISGIIIICLPDYFSKYKVDLVQRNDLGDALHKIYYQDLDGDSLSERIEAQVNTLGDASYLIYKSNGDFVDQFNLDTKYPTTLKGLWFSDVDNNGFKEIFNITQSADSAFLNIREPFKPNGINRQRIFVDTISMFDGENKFRIQTSGRSFNKNINNSELVFNIMTGFAANPRNAYKYDFNKNNIIKSPHLANSFSVSKVIDLDDDGKEEIIISNNASNNQINNFYTHRPDSSTWLMVLNDDLSFMFEPIEFKALGSISNNTINVNNKTRILSFFVSRQYDKLPSRLLLLSTDGVIEKEKILQKGSKKYLVKVNSNQFAVTDRVRGEVVFFNTNLEEINKFKIEPFKFIEYYDIDNDGKKEWVIFRNNYDKISIYRDKFEYQVEFTLADVEGEVSSYGIQQISKTENQLYFQKGAICELFSYNKNPLYAFQYILYLMIYALILLLVWLVAKGQKIRMDKQQAIATEISELQIKSIKNQVDPHFVFNAINTISEMILMDNKLEADKFIGRFSNFMRDTLQQSDKISTTLKAELEYTENFIKLQQIRFINSFNYAIAIGENVDLKAIVPKHVLFTYTENAIKHGLALTKNGMLKINVKKQAGILFMSVEDNGMGMRQSKTNKKNSTGNGLLIMNRIFDLYSKLKNKKIKQHVIELKDAKGNNAGVRVEVEILNK